MLCVFVPTGRKEIARGNAPGKLIGKNPALKGRNRRALSGLVFSELCYPGLAPWLSSSAPFERMHRATWLIHRNSPWLERFTEACCDGTGRVLDVELCFAEIGLF